jgi:hypothetical protein
MERAECERRSAHLFSSIGIADPAPRDQKAT